MTWAAPVALTGCCLACVAALLLAERAGSRWGRVLLKLGASSSFVAVAVSLGAPGSVYGRWMLAALLLGWLGDALLLSRQPPAFLAGVGAFLLSHLCFALAFLGGAWWGADAPEDYNASAPETISISSLVMAAWRARLFCSVSRLIRSVALRVALSMAVIRAACSPASVSRKAWSRRPRRAIGRSSSRIS